MWVMRLILKQEVDFIKSGTLSAPRQGRHAKITSWLTDKGTMLAMQEYMSVSGEGMFTPLILVFRLHVLNED